MRHFHKHSSFPLIVILLSVGLVAFMFYAFTYEATPTEDTGYAVEEEVVPVDANQYRQDLTSIVQSFEDEYAQAEDDLTKLVVTETALAQLLDLIVPAEYKDLHLNLAVAFHQLEASLRSADRDVEEPLADLDLLFGQYPWLTP